MHDAATVVATLATGVVTGGLSGMFGVGGAVVSTPAVRALGATPLQAVGTTLPSIFPSAVTGTLRYHREGLVWWRAVAWASGVGTGVAVGAALLSGVIPGDGHWLMVMTAALIGYTATRLARHTPAEPLDPGAAVADPAGPERGEWWRLAVCGAGAGALSGLLGLGGGVVLVPAFLEWVRMPIKRAVGTSLACVGLLAVPSTIAHALLGNIDWGFAIPLSIAVVPGARLGAAVAIRSSDRGLRLSVASVLGAIAVVYAVREITLL